MAKKITSKRVKCHWCGRRRLAKFMRYFEKIVECTPPSDDCDDLYLNRRD